MVAKVAERRVMRWKGTGGGAGYIWRLGQRRVVVRSTSRRVRERGHVAGARAGAASASGVERRAHTRRGRNGTEPHLDPGPSMCETGRRSGRDGCSATAAEDGQVAKEVYTFAIATRTRVGEGRPHETVAA